METTLQKNNQVNFSDDQVALIKKQIAPRATDDELKLFLYQAKRTGLDPLARQIYCIHRKAKDMNGNWSDRMTVQTSIDGFRVIAERSGDYAGQGEPEFVEHEGKIICCKVPVFKFRGEQRYQASVGVAYWDEYVPKEGHDTMWRKMPHTMISKVAEALGLRKAYPQDLSGLYTNDEMQQTDAKEMAPEPEKSCDELKAEFMALYDEYVKVADDPKSNLLHPDNWKKEQNINTFKGAIAAIKIRLNGFSGRINQ